MVGVEGGGLPLVFMMYRAPTHKFTHRPVDNGNIIYIYIYI